MPSVLSTKKLLPNQRELLLNAGVSFVEYGAIEIEPIDFKIPEKLDDIIITSKNAAKRIVEAKLKVKNFYCVGEKTAQYIKQHNYNVIEIQQSSFALGKEITKKHRAKSFTYFCGKQRLDALPEQLKISGIFCQEILVYETKLIVKQFDRQFDAILFFSPSGVTSYIKGNYPTQIEKENEKVESKNTSAGKLLSTGNITDSRAICIGNTTAAKANNYFYSCFVANSPTIESTIAKAVKTLKK